MNIVETDRKNVLLKVYIDANMDKDFSILSKTIDIFLLINLQGKIVYANQICEDLVGYTFIELMGMTLPELFVPDYLNGTESFFKNREQEKLDNFDAQIQVKQGNIIDVNVTGIPIYFEEEFLGSYLVLKDITAIKMKRRKMMNQYNNMDGSNKK